MEKWITIVGCGPGSPDYVTPAARRACAAADVAAGAGRMLDLFPEFVGERIIMEKKVTPMLDAVAKINGRRRVVILVSGDPGVFSLAGPVIRRFTMAACTIVPGISSVQVAFSRIGLSGSDAEILSAHHEKPGATIDALLQKEKIAVLAGTEKSFEWIAEIRAALSDDYRAFTCEDLTLESERIREADADLLQCGSFSSKTVVLFIRRQILT